MLKTISVAKTKTGKPDYNVLQNGPFHLCP